MARLLKKRGIDAAMVSEEDPTLIRRSVIEHLSQSCECDFAGLIHVHQTEEGIFYGEVELGSTDPPGPRDFLVGKRCLPSLENAILQPHVAESNRFIDDRTQARILGLDHWSQEPKKLALFDALDIQSQLRMLVFHHRRFVDFAGVWRFRDRPEFDANDLETLNQSGDITASRLLAAHFQEEKNCPDRTLYLVADEEGEILHAAMDTRGWLDAIDLGPLRSIIRETHRSTGVRLSYVFSGMELRLTPMDTNAGALSYLIHLSPRQNPKMAPDADLTPTQREIAHLAATGATIEEIADMLGRSAHTVKTHLRNIYERLGVANRVELAEVLTN